MLTPNIMAFYNDNNAYCCSWLSNLMDAGLITPGTIDDRSIKEIEPKDLEGFHRVHFFAGIAGWELALNLANWGSRFVWTGSCPCQPFSDAGSRKAQQDERHLWPDWYRIIKESKPATIFGEQTARGITYGWLDDAFHDLEKENYACAAAVLPAVSVAAPHERSRIFFIADTSGIRCERYMPQSGSLSACKEDRRMSQFARDNYREIEPGMGRVANGVSCRVERLSAFGNAIVPQVAAEFIAAFMECRP